MANFINLENIRRDYGNFNFDETAISPDPIVQFKLWLAEVLVHEKNDPTAMVLSTVDTKGHPDSRVVLLKGIEQNNFVFFTNYLSAKGMQIKQMPYVALNFYWPQMARQVRVRGAIKKLNKKKSDNYFSSRPLLSQYSTLISAQSREIPHRFFLEHALEQCIMHKEQKPIARPHYWGGYLVMPEEIEFWQGRDNRLHDRIHYYKQEKIWLHHRLAP